MLYIERNSKRAPAFKKDIYKALISGMTDFAHLNDCILQANFKFKTAQIHDTLEVLIDRLLIKLQCCLLFFPQPCTQITISQFGATNIEQPS